MTPAKEETSCSSRLAIDLISAVKALHGRSTQELHKLLKENEDFTVCYFNEKGSSIKIDVEKLAGFLPLHLIAVLMSSDTDEAILRYLLSGIRLLHSLCELAPRHTKLEQVLLDDVKVSEQMLDLVFYSLIILGGNRQVNAGLHGLPLMTAAVVSSCLYLLTSCVSSNWQDLVQVLLAHPKADIFIDVAFGAVHNIIRSLQIKLLVQGTEICTKSIPTAGQVVTYLCQQGEVSLQFLLSLCQQKSFRERLVKNKELCGNGGVLMLAQSILLLHVPPRFAESSAVVTAISRLKAKVLSILLHLFEAESVSFLDEVASSGNLHLAKSIASEVLEILKTTLCKTSKHVNAHPGRTHPTGLLQLNAMRLADIFTDDSNFRSYFTENLTEVLSAIFSHSHGDFLSMWCSSDLPSQEGDATLEYDQYGAAGWVLDSPSNEANRQELEFNLVPSNMPQASYVHQRTSLFIKMIANLHCFVPSVCEEQERNRFLNNFKSFLQKDHLNALPSLSCTSSAQRASSVCRNLRSLLSHAESLIPNFLNEEDLQLLRVFFEQLQSRIRSEFEEIQIQEAQSAGGCSSPKQRKAHPGLNNQSGTLREEMSETSACQDVRQEIKEDKDKSGILREGDTDVAQNVETSGSDTSSTRGKNSNDRIESSKFRKLKGFKESVSGGVKEEEKVESVQGVEKQRRKRKRSIMNDEQMAMVERALVDEPDMQRNAALLQSWADKLCHYGSEVTPSQLRNWLNNRKAKLARASKEADIASGRKQAGNTRDNVADPVVDSLPAEENVSSKSKGTSQTPTNTTGARTPRSLAEFARAAEASCLIGRQAMLVDGHGGEVGKGRVHLFQGIWGGKSLEESETCVVDITELKADRDLRLPYPSEAMGTTLEDAETKIGVMRVMWDLKKIYLCDNNE